MKVINDDQEKKFKLCKVYNEPTNFSDVILNHVLVFLFHFRFIQLLSAHTK